MPAVTTGYGFKPAPRQPPITVTGPRGFLLWLQREQPAVYAQMAPQLPSIAPSAFSSYMGSTSTNARKLGGLASLRRRNRGRGMAMGALGHFGQDTGAGTGDELTNYFSTTSSGITGDIDTGTLATDTGSTITAPSTTDAANTTAGLTTPQANDIAKLATGITGLVLAGQQLSTANAITNLQLQRAQEGLAPLNIGMNANGVPTISGISTTASSGLIMLLLVGGLAAVFLLSGKGS